MKTNFNYTDKQSYSDIDVLWLLSIIGKEVHVTCHGETRIYDIKENIVATEQEDEYIYVHVDNGMYYQFKLELDRFLVVDTFTKEGEFIDSFGCHTFGDDNE